MPAFHPVSWLAGSTPRESAGRFRFPATDRSAAAGKVRPNQMNLYCPGQGQRRTSGRPVQLSSMGMKLLWVAKTSCEFAAACRRIVNAFCTCKQTSQEKGLRRSGSPWVRPWKEELRGVYGPGSRNEPSLRFQAQRTDLNRPKLLCSFKPAIPMMKATGSGTDD
jgi:hypothetical protein